MHHPTFRRIGLAAATLLLTAGCAGNPLRRPAPAPAPGAPGQASLTPPPPGSTTVTPADDPSTCKAVLGQPPVETNNRAPKDSMAHGVLMDDYALVAIPSGERITTTPPGANQGTTRVPTAPTAPGIGVGTNPGELGSGKPNGSAPTLNRIRAACNVSRIHVVTEVADRARLVEIVDAINGGRPQAEFTDELQQMSRRAVSWNAGTTGNPATPEPVPAR